MRTILKKRAVGVAKSTAHLWTSKAKLSNAELEKLSARLLAVKRQQVKKLAGINQRIREHNDAIIHEEARNFISSVNLTSDFKKLLCSVMFWCEGGKNARAGIQFINSDPLMVKKFLELFREAFQLDESKFQALVHLHEYHDPIRQLEYWSKVTSIPLRQFHKSYLKANTGKNIREGYPGCISVRYLDGSIGKLLKMIYIEFSKDM